MDKKFIAPEIEVIIFDRSEEIMTNNSYADTETND